MSLANFFYRAEQSLGQILQAVSPEKLLAILNDKTIAVAFDDTAIHHINSVITIELITNLVARLYPSVKIVYSGNITEGYAITKKLTELALEINPNIEIINEEKSCSVALCIGNPDCTSERYIYMNSDSWNLEISIDKPINKQNRNILNPFSAAAVACLGISELFRIVFHEVLKDKFEPQSFTLSLLDYSKHAENYDEIKNINFNDLTLVGLGAIGNSIVWCLKWLPSVRGTINIVDPETIELSNLQRYVLSNQSNINKLKVDIARDYLSNKELTVNISAMSFGEYVKLHRNNCDFDLIAVTVDNAFSRIAAQAVLPKVIFNAWTGDDGSLGISRHIFDHPQKACLACLYLPMNKQQSRTERIAEIIGFEPMRTSELVVKQVPMNQDLLREISQVKGYPLSALLPYEGKTLDDFYTEAICGGTLLPVGNNAGTNEANVPLAHQSVLAGILLACELVKEVLGLIPIDYPVETRMNVLSKLPDFFCSNRGKTTNPKCICSDKDYLDLYKNKFM